MAVKIVFMGTPWFSVPVLERLLSDGYDVVSVYTQPDKEAGRGRSVISSAVKKTALEYGIPVEQPDQLKSVNVLDTLRRYHPDYIVVFSYGQILPQAVLDIPAGGCINVHPSLLPKYRGAAPVVSAILGGDVFTGVTIMKMSVKLDAGDILAQSQVPVADYDTAVILTEKLSLTAARMVPDILYQLRQGAVTPRPQDDSLATYSTRLSKKDGEIDWSLGAVDIQRRVRAFDPWPGCFTTFRGKQLKIIAARLYPALPDIRVGQVILLDDRRVMGVGTGQGILGVTEVQPEGKRRMAAGDFMLGQKNLSGEILPSQAEV
jgi:methionyl-tRNA formyltransferase